MSQENLEQLVVEEQKPREMTSAEAKKYRAAQYKALVAELTEEQKREQFRLYWAENKYKYGRSKDIEEIVWVHIKSAKLNDPKDFEAGIKHFGLKAI